MADSQFADLGVPLPLFVIGLQLTQILYQLAPFVLMKGSGTLFKSESHEKFGLRMRLLSAYKAHRLQYFHIAL